MDDKLRREMIEEVLFGFDFKEVERIVKLANLGNSTKDIRKLAIEMLEHVMLDDDSTMYHSGYLRAQRTNGPNGYCDLELLFAPVDSNCEHQSNLPHSTL